MATTENPSVPSSSDRLGLLSIKLSLLGLQGIYLATVFHLLLRELLAENPTDLTDIGKSTLLTTTYCLAELLAIARENPVATHLFAIFDGGICTGTVIWALIQCNLSAMPHLLCVAFAILMAVFADLLLTEANHVSVVSKEKVM